MHLQWDDVGVLLNPELKLLQYNLGQPLEVAESIGYMPEKHGKINDSIKKLWRFFMSIGSNFCEFFINNWQYFSVLFEYKQ